MFRLACFAFGSFVFAASLAAQDMPLSQVLIDGEGWQLVSDGHKFTEGPAADKDGNVYFTDVPASKIWRVDAKTGKVTLFADNTANTNGLMFGPDGRLYGCRNGEKEIVAYDMQGKVHTIAEGVESNDLVVTSEGGVYFTDPGNQQVWYVSPDGKKRVVAKGWRPNGIILWPHEGTAVITDSNTPHLWAFRIEPDGSLKYGEKWYGPVRVPTGGARPGSDGMTVDKAGRLFLACSVGLQMFDTQGRPSGVIAKPQNKSLSNVTFGGPGFSYFYVTCTDKVYRRKTKTAGAPYFLRAKKN